MPIQVACASCGSRLKAPDALAGKKVKCPKCGTAVAVPDAALTEAPAPAPRPKPPPDAVTEKPTGKKPPPREEPAPEPDEAGPAPDEEREDRPRRKKRRRRKRRRSGTPAWVWWVAAGGGSVVGLLVTGVALIAFVGFEPLLLVFVIAFAIQLVLSTLIFILSMFISSAIVGGMEFGEIHTVIPKAMALLIVVNIIAFVPFGWIPSLIVMAVGCVVVFQLEMWEARVLVGVNVVLNVLVWYLVIPGIFTFIEHRLSGNEEGVVLPPHPTLIAQQAADFKALETLGGGYEADAERPGAPVIGIAREGARATEADVARPRGLSRLQALRPTRTPVPDAGVRDVRTALPQLQDIAL
jgi:hypothetical protein